MVAYGKLITGPSSIYMCNLGHPNTGFLIYVMYVHVWLILLYPWMFTWFLAFSWCARQIMEEDFYAKYQGKLLGKSALSANGQCRLWEGFTDADGYGKMNIKLHGRWTNRGVHRLSYVITHRTSFEAIEDLQVSHLCHNKTCITVAHLNLEEQETNNSRTGCVNARRCLHHGDDPDCLLGLGKYVGMLNIKCVIFTRKKICSSPHGMCYHGMTKTGQARAEPDSSMGRNRTSSRQHGIQVRGDINGCHIQQQQFRGREEKKRRDDS